MPYVNATDTPPQTPFVNVFQLDLVPQDARRAHRKKGRAKNSKVVGVDRAGRGSAAPGLIDESIKPIVDVPGLDSNGASQLLPPSPFAHGSSCALDLALPFPGNENFRRNDVLHDAMHLAKKARTVSI